ncbi:MAG: insulinase family protein [Acholeplasmatales bacterium]|nr:insulinase family protein [Acholeplasmatales bacterium]
MDYKKIELNKATLHIFKTKKFKKMTIDVIMSDMVNETNLSYRMLLSRMMESKSSKYDTKQKINRKLDMLYGANFGFSSLKLGNVCYIDASIDGVNPKYVGDDTLLDEMFKFLSEMLFNPILDKKNLDEEKRLLLDDYKEEYENKSLYAVIRSNEIAFKDELARLKFNGDEKIVKSLTCKDLEEYYKYMIENNKVDIIVMGDVSDDVIDEVKKYFDFGKKNKLNPIDYVDKEIINSEYVKEEAKSMQSQLILKYRTFTRMNDKDDLALVLANTIFGGFSSSLLFSVVREKESLCYSISSNYGRYKGIVNVCLGINKENYDKALKVTMEQFDRMVSGNFSDELLEMAKLSLISSIKKGTDSLSSIAKKIYLSELLNENLDLYDGIEEIKNLTKEDVINVMKKLKLDLVYFLEGSDNDE